MKRKNLSGENLRAYNYNHTKDRIEERYGISMSKSNYENLCKRIIRRVGVHEIKKEHQKRGVQRIFGL